MSSSVLMAPTTITLLPLLFLCILSSQVLLPLLASPTPQPSDETSTSSNGFSLELIPPHSPKSPLHKYYTTMQQQYDSPPPHGLSTTEISHQDKYTAPIRRELWYFLFVEVGIGTFTTPQQGSSKTYYLTMDTGSSLTWAQCEECKLRKDGNCFKMKEEQKEFPNRESKSYKPLICEPPEPLCTPRQCIDEYCSYFTTYGDKSYSKGFLAKETLNFRSSTPSTKEAIFEGIGFGCGINSSVGAKFGVKFEYPGAGIFGLGRGALSFARQIEQKINGRFSYCIVNNGNFLRSGGKPMFLRFGDDIKPPQKLQTIKFLQDKSLYYVNLQRLGVNGKRLSIEPSVFERKKDGTGGCIVDSGTSVSSFGKKVYDILVQDLKAHFARLSEFEKLESKSLGDLCYKRKGQSLGYKDIPGINFYFDNNAALNVVPEGTFSRRLNAVPGFEVFCLQVLPSDGSSTLTILGAYQQVDHKFIYDVKLNQLQFAPEDCANKG